MKAYRLQDKRLQLVDAATSELTDIVWLDLYGPTPEEEHWVEASFGLGMPTREEMQEIEVSSRLYYEDGVAFMTANLPARSDSDDLLMGPITFVLAGERLITVRYHEPRVFQTFPQRAEKANLGCTNGESVLLALLEASVDRLADVLERIQRDIDTVSRDIFQGPAVRPVRSDDLQAMLRQIGRKGDVISNLRDSLGSLRRVAGFLGQLILERNSSKDTRGRVKMLSRDVLSLTDHASFLSQKTTFLLDATLGLINIQQNAIIKIFSVAAVVFLPPTLLASIYGMNFVFMPELEWPLGYPLALALMLASAILPYLYFKRRGWL